MSWIVFILVSIAFGNWPILFYFLFFFRPDTVQALKNARLILLYPIIPAALLAWFDGSYLWIKGIYWLIFWIAAYLFALGLLGINKEIKQREREITK